MSGDSTTLNLKSKQSFRRVFNQQPSIDDSLAWIPESVQTKNLELKTSDEKAPPTSTLTTVEIAVQRETPGTPPATSSFLSTSVSTTIITTSSSSDTLNGENGGLAGTSGPSSPSNISSVTLVGSTGSGSVPSGFQDGQSLFQYTRAPSSPLPERKRKPEQQTVDSNANETIQRTDDSEKMPSTSTTSGTPTAQTKSVDSKPTIVSAIIKSPNKENGNRSVSPGKTTAKPTSNVLQPNINYLSTNRRPSAGTIAVPVAALIQHRHSLQMNSSEGGFGFHRVSYGFCFSKQ